MRVLKEILSVLLRISISVVLLVLFFRFNHIDIRELFSIIKDANRYVLASAFFIYFLTYLLCFYRWKMLLLAVNINLPSQRLVQSFCGGAFLNLFLPSTIGGDFARSIDLSWHTKRPREVVATVLLDRLSGYVGLTIVVLVSLFLGWEAVKNETVILLPALAIIAVLTGILLVLFNNFIYSKVNRFFASPGSGKLKEAIRSLHEEMHIFIHRKRMLFNNILFSLFIQFLGVLSFYMIALSLGIHADIVYYFIFLPIITAVTLLPISMGGFGVRENTAAFFFAKAGIDTVSAGAMAILNSFFILTYGLIAGVIYLVLKKKQGERKH